MYRHLLVLADETKQATHGALLRALEGCIRAEGNFATVTWDWVPRATTLAPDRHEKVLRNMDRIRQVRPDAILILGGVALPASGHGMPDGHAENHSVLWSDVPYAFPDVPMEDKQALVTSGLPVQTNVANDERGDRSYYTGFLPLGPVGRVDFSDLVGLATQPGSVPCYTGPLVPSVDENKAFEKYLIRNIAYRTGNLAIERRTVWQDRVGLPNTESQYQSELSWLPWYRHTSELPDPSVSARFVFSGVMPEAYWYYLDRNCEEMRGLVRINYRSNAWEVRGRRQGLVRALMFGCLVSLWGMQDWHFWPNSRVVADDVMRSWLRFTPSGGGSTGVPILNTVMGDVTLPYHEFPYRVTGLRLEP